MKKIFFIVIVIANSICAMEIDNSVQTEHKLYEDLKKRLQYDPEVVVFLDTPHFVKQWSHAKGNFGVDQMTNVVMTGFHHGFGDEGSTAQYLAQRGVFSCGYTFNFKDCKGRGNIDMSQANVGQDNDAYVASEIAKYINALYKPQKINLFGQSRGGHVVLYLLGKMRDGKYEYLNDEIRAKLTSAILDAPLGDMRKVIKLKREQITASSTKTKPFSFIYNVMNSITSVLPSSVGATSRAILESSGACSDTTAHHLLPLVMKQHKPNAITGVECAKTIDPSLPMLLYTTQNDSLIPAQTVHDIAFNRMEANRSSGSKTYVYIAPEGDHIQALTANSEQSLKIIAMIHAFRKKYNAGDVDDELAKKVAI
jgi:pimeloyl-ACP methyl ester carboxylesterase